jgi:hypothetical protein
VPYEKHGAGTSQAWNRDQPFTVLILLRYLLRIPLVLPLGTLGAYKIST